MVIRSIVEDTTHFCWIMLWHNKYSISEKKGLKGAKNSNIREKYQSSYVTLDHEYCNSDFIDKICLMMPYWYKYDKVTN